MRVMTWIAVVALAGSVVSAQDPSYFGTWKFDPAKSNLGKVQIPPFDLEIVRNGADGLIVRFVGMFESTAKFDGKPYPMTGSVPPKATASFTQTGPRAFRMVQKQDATTMLDVTLTVSADGKTLTQSGVENSGQKMAWVFERIK
jgi:hypothetical protein